MFSLPVVITVLAVAALASASSAGTPTHRRLNPAPADMAHTTPRGYIHARSAPATNARRFSLGLPPLAPRHHRVGVAARSSPVPPTTYAQISPASRPRFSRRRFIEGKRATSPYSRTTRLSGISARRGNGFGEYGQFQADQAGSLEVTFSYTPDSPSQLNFMATNSPSPTYPYFGAISGFASESDDFGSGSYNYAYLGGTTSTPVSTNSGDNNSFSAATGIPETIESAIWSYDPATQAITAQWINTDGSAPATHIVYANDFNQALVLTGSVAAFQGTFGAPYPEVTFTCVPPPSIGVDVSATVE
ncbi:hypothetical protein B0H14DRAFT_3002077 [Mycena olivaceomarginata]|nr:hypothetical protein B0H14DRAFT_3002077 [Mycena olivaceomarginata]